jgi:hypothetical protein
VRGVDEDLSGHPHSISAPMHRSARPICRRERQRRAARSMEQRSAAPRFRSITGPAGSR